MTPSTLPTDKRSESNVNPSIWPRWMVHCHLLPHQFPIGASASSLYINCSCGLFGGRQPLDLALPGFPSEHFNLVNSGFPHTASSFKLSSISPTVPSCRGSPREEVPAAGRQGFLLMSPVAYPGHFDWGGQDWTPS